MDEIILIGGGGHCNAVIDVIEQQNRYKIAGIIDKHELLGTKVLDYNIIGTDDDLEELYKKYKYALVTVGQIKNNNLKVKLFNKLKLIGYKLPIIISPLAYVSKYASINEGTIIMHHALLNANVKVGKNCIINSKALLEHDSTVEDHCHISTAAVVNGGCSIMENSFIGSNSVIKEYTFIEKNNFVKAGSIIK